MAVENIILNLIPTGDTPSIHVAQFDVDRLFTVTLKEGEDDFTPTGYTIELQVRKVDATIVTVLPTQTSGNVVTFNTTEQMTACSGTNIAELQLTKDSQTFATLHFYLVVQRDVLAGGLTSESDIYNLTEQIAAIVPEVIGDDYYNKSQTDALLNDKADVSDLPDMTNYYNKSQTDALLNDKADVSDLPDMTNYYNKSQTDALLNDKADVSDLPDMTNYYNKSQTDALLNDKADVSDLPDMTDYYTKKEVDIKVYNILPTDIASGSIASFTDGADNIPVKSIVSQIVVVESGSGKKLPTNPYTISGFDSADIVVSSKNLWGNGNVSFTGNSKTVFLFQPLPPNIYTISATVTSTDTDATTCLMLVYYTDGTSSGALQFGRGTRNSKTADFNKPIKSITFYSSDNYIHGERDTVTWSNIQIEASSEMTAYENPNIYTFAFGQTVYGGHFDNKGNLTSDKDICSIPTATAFSTSGGHNYVYFSPSGMKNESGSKFDILSEVIQPNGQLGDYFTIYRINTFVVIGVPDNYSLTDYNTEIAGTRIVYPLDTPITLSITRQDISTLFGENNFFSDTGDLEVNYYADIGLYIDKKISE